MQTQAIDQIGKWECELKRQSIANGIKVKWYKISIILPNDMNPIPTIKKMLLKDTSPIFSHRTSARSTKKLHTNTHSSLNFLLIDLIEYFIVNALSTCLIPHLDGANPEASEREKNTRWQNYLSYWLGAQYTDITVKPITIDQLVYLQHKQ